MSEHQDPTPSGFSEQEEELSLTTTNPSENSSDELQSISNQELNSEEELHSNNLSEIVSQNEPMAEISGQNGAPFIDTPAENELVDTKNDEKYASMPADEHFLQEETHDEHETTEEEKELTEIEDDSPNYGSLNKLQLLKLIADAAEHKPVDEASRIFKAVRPLLDAHLQDEFNGNLNRFLEEGGEKDDFEYADPDHTKELYNKAFKAFRNRKSSERARQDAERAENLRKKEEILVGIKKLTEEEETDGSLRKLKDFQNEWKKIRNVPKEHIERLWESYHHFIHQFYDRLSIFNELKDLDRRKNLDQKIELTKKVAELALEPSAKRALILLKKFQEEWKALGPVPRENNEEVWSRFKQECDKIFEMIRFVREENQKVREENLAAKKALLAKALELSNFRTTRIREWLEQNTVANNLMEEWKKVGAVPLRFRESIWDEFRSARNSFFSNKNTFFKALHAERNTNYKIKTGLCEKAEAIAAQPIDFAKQTEEIKKLQDEWKKTGAVNDKSADAVWKRFRAACDLFFEKKALQYASQVEEQKQNLEVKRTIISRLEELITKDAGTDIINDLKSIQDDWNNAGFVPIQDKESINKVYSDLNDQAFRKFREAGKELRDLKEKQHLEALSSSPNGDMRLKREEKILADKLRGMRSDVSTWENNLGFFTKGSNSKKENPMVEQIKEKIDEANRQIKIQEEKLKTLKSFLKSPGKS